MSIRSLVAALAGLFIASASHAGVVTMEFFADGFQNAGVQFPGFNGPVSGRISWDSNNLLDPIAAFTDIDLEIAGHAYTLAEVGDGGQGTTQSAIGGLVHGANTAVGDGLSNDFLIVFDRVNPAIVAFAYTIQGKGGAIWWTPTDTSARFVDTNGVPEPSSLLLGIAALGALGLSRRRTARLPAAQACQTP